MVNCLLMICADLDNLTDLQPQGGCDDPNFTYYFKVLVICIAVVEFCPLCSILRSSQPFMATSTLILGCVCFGVWVL
ncbi:hypothetical protein ACS0TY_011980 [Phlomoides rotata]